MARATASASNGHRRSFSGRGFLCDDGAVDLDVSAHAPFTDVTGVGALGRQWRIDAGLNSDHELVQSGPYRIVRHPIYTSMLCLLLRRPWAVHLKSEISNLKSTAESCSRQLRGWADSLQNSEIKGQRHCAKTAG